MNSENEQLLEESSELEPFQTSRPLLIIIIQRIKTHISLTISCLQIIISSKTSSFPSSHKHERTMIFTYKSFKDFNTATAAFRSSFGSCNVWFVALTLPRIPCQKTAYMPVSSLHILSWRSLAPERVLDVSFSCLAILASDSRIKWYPWTSASERHDHRVVETLFGTDIGPASTVFSESVRIS